MSDEYPAIELMSATKHGSGSSSRIGWKLEVRTTYHQPTVVTPKFVIDHAWRHVEIGPSQNPWGANIHVSPYESEMLAHGLVGRTVVEAHRWAFLAYLEAANLTGALCIQTRLVAVEVRTTWQTKEIGVTEVVSSNSLLDRSHKETKPRLPNEEAANA